jgi:beta-barrel assembly-enhancing protease
MRTAILLALALPIVSSGAFNGENTKQNAARLDLGHGIPAERQGREAQPKDETPRPEPVTANWRSPENEVKLGKFFSMQLEYDRVIVPDPISNNYMAAIAQKLGGACNASFGISIKIIDTENIQAVALPGGFISISSGLVSAAQDEAELAAAIAHQMAHSCAHQLVRGMSKDAYQKVINPPIPLDNNGFPITYSVSFPPPPFSQDFPPKFEAEADALAVQYMYKSGYDPAALLTLAARLNALNKTNSDAVSSTFVSHLQTPGQIRQTKRRIKSLAGKNEYIVNSSEFDLVKARLQTILARRRSKGNKAPIWK